MTIAIRWSQRAALRLEQAALHFDSVRSGAGLQFIDDVATALDRAANHPMANPSIPGEPSATRKIVLPRFGYWVIYELRDRQIVVLTLWAAVRAPGSWRDDVPDQP